MTRWKPVMMGLLSVAACSGGETVTNQDTITNTLTNTVVQTNTVTNTVTIPNVEPGHWEAPLIEIQELIGSGGALGISGGGQTGMHIQGMAYREGDGVNWPDAVFVCSYTFAAFNADNKDSLSFLMQGFKFLPRTGTRDPGCINMTFDEDDMDIVYAGHRGNISDGLSFVSGWDLNSIPADPVLLTSFSLVPTQLPMMQEPGEQYEGMDFEHHLLYVTSHGNGLLMFQRDPLAGNALTRVGSYTTGLLNSWDVKVDGDRGFVCDAEHGLVTLDFTDPLAPVEMGRIELEGSCRHLDLDDTGTILFVAAQSAGFHAVGVADLANPTLLGSVSTGTNVMDVDADGTYLYVAGWNDTRAYDITDPANMAFIGAVRSEKQKNYAAGGPENLGDEGERPDMLSRVLAIAGSDGYIFGGTWHAPKDYLLHPENVAPYIVVPEEAQYLAFPGDLAIGETSTRELEIRNDGTAPLAVFDIWTTNPAFTVTPSEVVIQPGTAAMLTLTFTATIGWSETTDPVTGEVSQHGQEVGYLQIWSDDPSQPTREAYLAGNPEGLAVGDVYTNNATLLDGTPWSFTEDSLGQVTKIVYFATYCPVCGSELPDLQYEYIDRAAEGLNIVALNSDSREILNVPAIQDYVDSLGLTFPVGTEADGEGTYDQITSVYEGSNPFPTIVIVDKSGIIQYIAREYDPLAIEEIVNELLAEQ